jgi:hypothetical protein
VSTADAADREAAWLATTTDALPALPATSGGPWQVIQAYWPGAALAAQKTGIYVLRTQLEDVRHGSQRIRPAYEFHLKLVWPVRVTREGIAETEQRALDAAVDLLIQRIRGPLGDKTHGGRFLSVGEDLGKPAPAVTWDDPEQTIPAGKALRALVTYHADDFEIND